MSLDALSSVAYGPEAIVLGLIVAGTAAVTWTVPIAMAIAGCCWCWWCPTGR